MTFCRDLKALIIRTTTTMQKLLGISTKSKMHQNNKKKTPYYINLIFKSGMYMYLYSLLQINNNKVLMVLFLASVRIFN